MPAPAPHRAWSDALPTSSGWRDARSSTSFHRLVPYVDCDQFSWYAQLSTFLYHKLIFLLPPANFPMYPLPPLPLATNGGPAQFPIGYAATTSAPDQAPEQEEEEDEFPELADAARDVMMRVAWWQDGLARSPPLQVDSPVYSPEGFQGPFFFFFFFFFLPCRATGWLELTLLGWIQFPWGCRRWVGGATSFSRASGCRATRLETCTKAGGLARESVYVPFYSVLVQKNCFCCHNKGRKRRYHK